MQLLIIFMAFPWIFLIPLEIKLFENKRWYKYFLNEGEPLSIPLGFLLNLIIIIIIAIHKHYITF